MTQEQPQRGGVIAVLNPNSLVNVTQDIDRALAPWRALSVAFECHTSPDGPPGIVTQADVDASIMPMRRLAEGLQPRAAAFIVACFSDPGLQGLRESLTQPVFGIGESALHTACTRGERIGVIAISSLALARHWRFYRAMGLLDRVAGERAIDLPVAESGDPQRALSRLIDVGRQLRDQDRVDVLVLGCAGMGLLRDAVEEAVQLPVVEPCQAAMAMAVGAVVRHAP